MRCFILWFSVLLFLLVINAPVNGQSIPDSILNKIDKLEPLEKIDKLLELTWDNREKNPDMALALAEKGIHIAHQHNISKPLGQLYGFTGVIYQHYKDQTETAIPFYHESLKISIGENDSSQIGYIYNNLGDAFYKIGNVPLAEEYADKSLEVFQSLNHTSGIAYSYINIGFVSRIQEDYDKAISSFRKAIEIRETIDDSVGIASATLELGKTYKARGDYDEAMKYFRKSLELHRLIKNNQYMAYSLNGMGDIFLYRKDYESALNSFKKAIELNKTRKNESGLIDNYLGIAILYSELNEKQKGEKYLNMAFDKANSAKNPQNLLTVFRTKAQFYENIGKYRTANLSYRKYLEVYDSLYSQQQFQTLSEIKNRFAITEKLSETNKNLEIKRKEQIYFYSIILLLLVITAGAIARYRAKVKMNNKLKDLNHTKDKVFSVISHDLKSPFNTLIGFSEILIEELEEGNTEDAEEQARMLNKTANDSYLLITNLLNWSRSQRDTISFDPEELVLEDVLEDIISLSKGPASDKNISIVKDFESGLSFNADRDLLSTVLTNLITNAIKFTPQNGEISIEATKANEIVTISVADTGIGIPPENLKKLFNVKDSFTTRGTNNEKGTGLGLLVCKDFVEIHGGEITAESQPNKGSRFTFTIPQK